MKIIHCSDLHLDSKIDRIPAQKSKIRREEILMSFEKLCDYAYNNGVEVIIIAGDMFDTAKISSKTIARITNCISKYSNLDFLVLSGNHDENALISSIENVPNNLKMFGETWTSYVYGNVSVSGIINTGSNIKYCYDNLNLNKDNFNIVVMHGQIAGYQNNDDKTEIISIPFLKNKFIDYLALGHYHFYSKGVIDERGEYAYSGCLDGRGFDETEQKGFVLIDTDLGVKNNKFIPFSSRCLYEVEYTVNSDNQWFKERDNILEILKNKYDSGSLIKLILKGEITPRFDIDKDNLSMLLNEYFFFAKIIDKTQMKIEKDFYENDKSVRGEFVRLIADSELSEEQKKSVLIKGLNALKGEIN